MTEGQEKELLDEYAEVSKEIRRIKELLKPLYERKDEIKRLLGETSKEDNDPAKGW